jgi:enoyl-CoA hydratase/carnithine racemase
MPVEVLEQQEGKVRIVRLDRTEKRNALSLVEVEELERAFATLATAGTARVVVLTGAGGDFSAGADIGVLAGLAASEAEAFSRRMQTLCEQLANLPQVTIAAVEGYALGGGMELALAADMRVAARGAAFGVPEVRLGLFPAAGGTARLVELLGRALAARLLLTGEPLPAEALPSGFLLALVEPGEALARALSWAERLAVHPPEAVRAIKELLARSRGLGHEEALALEASAFARVFGTPAVEERLAAFLRRKKS